MYALRFVTKFCRYRLVINLFLAVIHIARPARRECDSSLLARLKKSERSDPDGEENCCAPPPRRAPHD